VLLTHDHDFLDDRKFPEHRNPGVVVLAGGDGDEHAMGTSVAITIIVFGNSRRIWEKSKAIISADGHLTIRGRDLNTGRLVISRFRRTPRGNVEIFEAE
jgi:hypothetical protein